VGSGRWYESAEQFPEMRIYRGLRRTWLVGGRGGKLPTGNLLRQVRLVATDNCRGLGIHGRIELTIVKKKTAPPLNGPVDLNVGSASAPATVNASRT